MTILTVRHLTRYRYRKPVAFGEHAMMLRPLESFDQRLIDYERRVGPQPALVRDTLDAFGNCLTLATFTRKARALEVEATFTVDHRPAALTDRWGAFLIDPVVAVPCVYGEEIADDLRGYAQPAEEALRGEVAAFARRFTAPVGPTRALSAFAAMTKAIRAEFSYGRRLSGGAQTAAQTLAVRTGACRDFAVLMMEAARSLGFAARFVSGYVVCGSPKDGKPRLGGGHTHAWLQIFLPDLGWVDFDPTNGLIGAQGLIRAAVVRHPRQACVLSGEYDGDPDDCLGMDVEVEVFESRATEPNVRVAA